MLIQQQTTFGDKCGNCFSTCIASLLDLPTAEVPNFCLDENNWFEHLDKWLLQRGLRAVDVKGCQEVCIREGACFIASGKSPRGDFEHSIIASVDGANNFIMVMDPHPSGAGLAEPFTSMMLLVRA